jgi:hypothetical protein
MRTSSLAGVVRASLGVAVVMTLGCDIAPFPRSPTTTPTPTATPAPGPEPSAAQRNAALALFDAAAVHAFVMTAPLTMYGSDYGKVMWANGPCDFGQGSMEGSLDGGVPPTPGTFLPTGSHTYVVSFKNCPVNYWGYEAFELHGVASAAYNVAEWRNITATVSADSVRGQDLATGWSQLASDVTADGSAVWTRSSNDSTTYTPAAGSRLVNNSTASVATFGGGSYSVIRGSSQGRPSISFRFDNLKVAVNGTEYTLDGSLVDIQTQPRTTYTGEIRIINNGTLVARILAMASTI